MITAVSTKEIRFSGGQKITLTQGMNAVDLSADVKTVAVNFEGAIFLHDNDAGGVDVHVAHDGKTPPDEWWEQLPDDNAATAAEASHG